MATLKQSISKLHKSSVAIAKQRDLLRDNIMEMQSLKDDADESLSDIFEALELLENAADALSRTQ